MQLGFHKKVSNMKSSKFWLFISLALLMVGCIALDINTISVGINKHDWSSIVMGGFAAFICLVALVSNIISAIHHYNED